ncbi:hypothetical protein DDQ68_03960 [Hymenobacter nivis]|uniref:TonB C-terminal domain-containing protein n=1 Tax=Hymenobacter nivis TaxID=1850093 RepID=A0A2Z3GRI6_9BACT|nr:hypothetical protein DDQ68_03960 [Hymenobacter nivis]
MEGRVFISFVISTTGEVKDVKVLKGLSASCDEAAVNAVKVLPRFIPGKQNGRPVAVAFTVPVAFKEPDPGAPPDLGPPRRGPQPASTPTWSKCPRCLTPRQRPRARYPKLWRKS